jgi:hypothetical protein
MDAHFRSGGSLAEILQAQRTLACSFPRFAVSLAQSAGMRVLLDNLAHALLNAETLDGADAYAAAGVLMRTTEPPAGVSAELQTTGSTAQ